jgi:AsmA family protein
VSAATGRDFHIEGDLRVKLRLTPTISAEGLHLSNAPWARGEEMASIDRIDVSIALLPLLRRELVLPMLHLERPLLLLERNQNGEANWTFGTPEESREPSRWSWRVDQLVVAKGELRFNERALDTDLRLQLRSADPAEAGGRAPLLAEGRGRYRNSQFELMAKVDSPLDLRDMENPYHIDLRAVAGATQAHVNGELRGPIQSEKFDVRFRLRGATLADLHRVIGVVLPDTPPYSLDGRLGRDGSVWRYRDFHGRVGDSDLGGTIAYDMARERPLLRGDLVSHLLDLDDLAGFIGATPGTGTGETASPAQENRARKTAENGRVLPQKEFRVPNLRAMDADVKLDARRIEARPLPLERMRAHLKIDDGVVTLDPLNFAAAGGAIESRVRMDARNPVIAAGLDVSVRRLELQKLFPTLKAPGVGLIGGHVNLSGQGNSVAQMLATADGDVGAVMGQGRLSNLILELAGLDVAEALKFLVGKDRMVTVRCAYADLDAKGGMLTVRNFAFDTTDTVLLAEGSADLREERLSLQLKPRPKDVSPVSLRGPLRVGGTFRNPTILPEPAPLALRAAAAVALFALTPPAALLALIETGPGEDTNCARAAGAESAS